MMINEICPNELYACETRDNQCQMIDVREGSEFRNSHIPGSKNISLSTLEKSYQRIDDRKTAYLICSSGVRAERAVLRLAQHGLTNTCVLQGGLAAWKAAGLPLEGDVHRTIPIERQVRITAAVLVLIGISLAYTVNPSWIWLATITALGMLLSGLTGSCAMGDLLAIAPWNRHRSATESSA